MILVDGLPGGAVPATDRGLNYGDGLFETLRLHAGRVPLLGRHLDRLRAGCDRLGLPWPGAGALEADVAAVTAGTEEGVVKILLTRGDGGRGYAPGADPAGRRLVGLHGLPARPSGPVEVGVCQATLGINPALAGLKHTSRLEQVMGAREAAARGWYDGLMGDGAGRLVEATRHNLFVVRGGRLVTPPVDQCGVAGIMRALVLEAAPGAGLDCEEAGLRPADLADAEEAFLANSVAGLVPVDVLAGRRLGERAAARALAGPLEALGVTWSAA